MSLRNGNEYFPKPRGAEVYDWNESEMKYQGVAEGTTAAPGTEWNENGNHILQAHRQSNTNCFLFSAQLMGGGALEALRAAKRAVGLIFVRLLYIMSAYVLFYSYRKYILFLIKNAHN